MNPMVTQIVGSVVRFLFASVSTWLLQRGVLNEGEIAYLLAGIVTALVTLGWSAWQKWGARLQLVTALALPPMSEARLDAKIAMGMSAPVMSDPAVQPTTASSGA